MWIRESRQIGKSLIVVTGEGDALRAIKGRDPAREIIGGGFKRVAIGVRKHEDHLPPIICSR